MNIFLRYNALDDIFDGLKERKRGEEYEWREVGKSNLTIFNIIII